MECKKFDVIVLTEDRYEHPTEMNAYVQNVITEDALLVNALLLQGLKVGRFSWSNSSVDWGEVRSVVFRTTWDYFERYEAFFSWFNDVKDKVIMFNDEQIINWNLDKIYLKELSEKGIPIPETIFIPKGCSLTLSELVSDLSTEEFVLKPNVSGAARHTYRLNKSTCQIFESTFQELIRFESFIVQDFQKNILTKGEVSLIVIDGKFTHAVLKKGKGDDFRVQDDFGGSVHEYIPNDDEIQFAERCVNMVKPKPIYCRVDLMWDNADQLVLSELEMIEPELWFRRNPNSALDLAKAIAFRLGS